MKKMNMHLNMIEKLQHIENLYKEKEKIKNENIKNLKEENEKLVKERKEQDLKFKIIYVGQRAQEIKSLIRTKILDNTKDNTKINSLVKLDKMVEEGSQLLTKNEVENWRLFQKKLEHENIQVDQLHDNLRKISSWRNPLAHPTDLQMSLSTLNESKDEIEWDRSLSEMDEMFTCVLNILDDFGDILLGVL
ncbi:uncharacterized protein LOC116849073 [Odontomachus brunneus]|uniref:uncharacterized protein LOC116849073 n=1 Tax=Odontomachus brunneus TaxID=486640 RepID=UPI0013F1F758|nr:uncharacterized protein LOC116849073 [Odontomachus brunneus]